MAHDLDNSELYWTRKQKGLVTEEDTERYIRELESNNYEANNIISEQIDLLRNSIPKSKVLDLLENNVVKLEVIDISSFECIAKEDVENLLGEE